MREVGDDPKDEKFQKLEENYSELEERSRTLQRIANEIAKETVFRPQAIGIFPLGTAEL